MAHCRFKTDIEYYDEKTGEDIPYECHEPEENILPSGLCIFHDENYLEDSKNKEANEQDLKRKLFEKLTKSGPLICIGYHIPDFSFADLHFDKSVNFSKAVFMGLTNFSKTQFKEVGFTKTQFTEKANFSGAKFTEVANFLEAQFTKEADFSGAKFTEVANFLKTQFTEKANFSGAKFTEVANFLEAKFTKVAYFSGAKFTEVANFLKTQFTKEADFSGAQFAKEADFLEAQFTDKANFLEAQFNKATFRGAQFTKEAVFLEAQFTYKATFTLAQFTEAKFFGVHFSKEADFSGAQFTDANFSGVHFSKEADFSGAQFAKEADFLEAQFTDKAIFTLTQFTELAYFSVAQFTEANFSEARFSKEATFSRAQFTEKANFSRAQFTEKANFSVAQFTEANFSGADFSKEADFSGAQFTEANFSGAQFTEKATFSGAYTKKAVFTQAKFNEAFFYKTQFAEKADFSGIQSTMEKANPRLDIHNVQFDIPEHVTFLKDNLSEISFVNTDITRVRFGEDVVWGDKFRIREEREIENQLKSKNVATDIQLKDILAVYRNLRENYEFRMRYGEAGEFFIREMEINRLYRQDIKNGQFQIRRNNWVTRNLSLTGLYYHLSRYGQSFSRPTIFGIGIILFSTLLWLTQPDAASPDFAIENATLPLYFNSTGNSTNIEVNSTNLVMALKRSLTNFLPDLSLGTQAGSGLVDFAFKIVGGAVTFGLIIIALRRKFERKFRH